MVVVKYRRHQGNPQGRIRTSKLQFNHLPRAHIRLRPGADGGPAREPDGGLAAAVEVGGVEQAAGACEFGAVFEQV